MGLDNLTPPRGSKRSAKRRGRGHGSGSGKTSGRGHKGQKSRSGASIPAWFEGGQMPLYRRTPKRGFKPYRRTEWRIVNLSDLVRVEGSEIDPGTLEASGVIRRTDRPVKILGSGDLDRAVDVRAHAFSASARAKIEAAGGTARVIE
ncbi:50S ribosomal protein L15 [Candidatus Palauibacter sp.]|uniref:50S ribosomal protein L15 n=1 Tax=Candidatus Palauibacter sp. TaxID=3101350 RepID=UPI003B51ACFD